MARSEAPRHLWDDLYSLDEDVVKGAREDLVIFYQYLVEGIARKLESRLPPFLEDSELVSMGQLGLLRAMGRYDPDHGPFSKYASTVIFGAIMDGLRAADFAPSGLRKKMRDIDTAEKEVRAKGLANPSDKDIAHHLEVEVTYIQGVRGEVERAEVSPTDPTLLPNRKTSGDFSGPVPWERDLCREFVVWLQKWDRQTQEIILLRYWKHVSLKGIGETLGLSPTAVKSKHRKFLLDLLPFMQEIALDQS